MTQVFSCKELLLSAELLDFHYVLLLESVFDPPFFQNKMQQPNGTNQ
jgi:hypothetical protein